MEPFTASKILDTIFSAAVSTGLKGVIGAAFKPSIEPESKRSECCCCRCECTQRNNYVDRPIRPIEDIELKPFFFDIQKEKEERQQQFEQKRQELEEEWKRVRQIEFSDYRIRQEEDRSLLKERLKTNTLSKPPGRSKNQGTTSDPVANQEPQDSGRKLDVLLQSRGESNPYSIDSASLSNLIFIVCMTTCLALLSFNVTNWYHSHKLPNTVSVLQK